MADFEIKATALPELLAADVQESDLIIVVNAAQSKKVTKASLLKTVTDRLTAIENEHRLVLVSSSTTTQEPATVGPTNAIQVAFGAAQSTTEVSLDTNGTVTINEAGKYQVRFFAHYGRAGAAGISLLAFRLLLNDVAQGTPQVSKLDDSTILLPWSDTYSFDLEAGDVLKGELMRDSSGDDSGGLYATTTDWGVAASSSLQIYKVG